MKRLLLLILLLATASFGAVTSEVHITETTGSDQVDRPIIISRVFKQGEIMLFPKPIFQGAAPSIYQINRKTSWPDGSAAHTIISFPATLLANTTNIVSFVSDTSPCHLANTTLCNLASLTQTQMLDHNGGTWEASINITNGTTLTADARTMMAAGAWRYWIQGPYLNQVIIEDRTSSLAYDLGWDAYETLHPMFIATFHAGWPGVKMDYILENCWTTKLQNMSYSVALNTSAGSPVYTKSTFTHHALARWRKTFWDGTEPGEVKIDYNLPYMIKTGSVPPFDTSRTFTETHILASLNSFANHDDFLGDIMGTDPSYGGDWFKGFAGMNPEAPIQRWDAGYLYTFDPRMEDLRRKNADVSGYVPIHYRESLTGRTFCALSEQCVTAGLHTADAFGRPISIDARPTVREINRNQGAVLAADKVTPVGTRTMGGWNPDTAHLYPMTYIAYLTSGDYYWLEEMYFWASWCLTRGQPPTNSGITNARHLDWGFMPSGEEIRGEAWSMLAIGMASLVSPETDPEKYYYGQKLANNIAIREGRHKILDGNFYEPCTSSPFNAATETSKHCWGQYYIGANATNPLQFLDNGVIASLAGLEPGAYTVGSPWMWNYNHFVFGWLEKLGFTSITPLRTTVIKNLLHQLRDPDYNPYLVDVFHTAVKTTATGNPFIQTWSEMKSLISDSDKTALTSTTPVGYVARAIAGAVFLPGINDGDLIGQEAWDWLHAHAGAVYSAQNSTGDLVYAFTPYDDSEPVEPPSITTTTVHPGTTGLPYNKILLASGTGTLTWTVTVGTLPTGITLSSPGVLSGTPTTSGQFIFTVQVTNSVGSSDTKEFTLNIGKPSAFSGLGVSGIEFK
jgi:hypothetical protein